MPLYAGFTLAERGGDAALALAAALPWGAGAGGSWRYRPRITPGTPTTERAASTAPTATGFLLEEPSRVLWGARDGRHQHCQQLSQCQDMPVQPIKLNGSSHWNGSG